MKSLFPNKEFSDRINFVPIISLLPKGCNALLEIELCPVMVLDLQIGCGLNKHISFIEQWVLDRSSTPLTAFDTEKSV